MYNFTEKHMNDGKKQTRSMEISKDYFEFLDQHIENVISGKTENFMELNQIASALSVSHKHLTHVIQKEFGRHPCYFYDFKIIERIKNILITTETSVAEIARNFTYDPSNFSKFFKKWTGETPGNFRKTNKN